MVHVSCCVIVSLRGINMKIQDILKEKQFNHDIALISGQEKLTYQQWYNCSENIMKLIVQTNMPSKGIALLLPNSINYAISYFGTLLSDHFVLPINPQIRAEEFKEVIEYTSIRIILTESKYATFVMQALRECNFATAIIYVNNLTFNIFKSQEGFFTKFPDTPNDLALMIRTSGTSAKPKFVMLSHKNIISNVKANVKALQIKREDKTLISLPMHFSYCNTAQFLSHVFCGATIVIMNGFFFPKSFIKLISTQKITTAFTVPSMIMSLINYRYVSHYNLSSLRMVCIGGDKMSPSLLKEAMKHMNNTQFVITYGLTEASPRVASLYVNRNNPEKFTSVGKAIPGIKISIKEPNTEGIGEVIISGDNIMLGYYKDPDETANKICKGWLQTGDLGYIDKDGDLFLIGRKKNIIISNGINISPEEIEAVIIQHPMVCDVKVFGKKDNWLGQIIVANVVSKDSNPIVDLAKFCTERLDKRKIPKRFIYVKEICKTPSGKIIRSSQSNTL